MKNTHVLPTDKKPIKGDLLLRHLWRGNSNECISWWRYNEKINIDDVIQYTTLNGSFRDITSSFKTHNIYITSDEDVKEGDWILDAKFNLVELAKYNHKDLKRDWLKIILTTDQELIKDGVQSIDDEFLNWFIDNPTCEEVKVKWIKTPDGIFYHKDNVPYGCYKIIIPKEEPKQERMYSEEEVLDILREHTAEIFKGSKLTLTEWFEQFKNK